MSDGNAEPSVPAAAAIAIDAAAIVVAGPADAAGAGPVGLVDEADSAAAVLATSEAQLTAVVAAGRAEQSASAIAAGALRKLSWDRPTDTEARAAADDAVQTHELLCATLRQRYLAAREAVTAARTRCERFAAVVDPVGPVDSASAGWNREVSARPLAMVVADDYRKETVQAEAAPVVRPPPMVHVPVGDLYSATITPPAFALAPLIPLRHVTLLGGHGGTGKSTLALLIAAHKACGTAWAGMPCEVGRVLVVSLEDAGELLRFRLRHICDTYGLDRAKVSTNLVVFDGSDAADAALGGDVLIDGRMQFFLSETGAQLEAIAAQGFALIVVDNASDGFAGNEIDRGQVKRFMRNLVTIGRNAGAAVLLLAHIDKQAARFGAAGNSFSGSTAWHNSARSRLALVDDNGVLELRHEKANLCRKAEPIRLHFNDVGVLLPAMFSAVAEQGVDALLLHCLGEATARGDIIGTGRTGPATALACAKHLPGFPAALRSPAAFWAALGRLEQSGQLVREAYQTDGRKTRHKFALAPIARVAPIDGTGATHTPAPVKALGVWGELAQAAAGQ